MVNPRSLVYALHKHWDVIEHLVRLTRDTPAFDRDQVLAVVLRHHPDGDGDAVLQALVTADVVQMQDRSGSVQVNLLVLEFVRGLAQEHELGLSEVLRARVDAIKDATLGLAEAVDSGDREQRRQSAGRLSELFRQILQQIDQDQRAILRLADESKAAVDGMPVQRRYQRVLEAFDRYIQPMTEMMDTGIDGAFHRHLEEAETVLDRAGERLALEGALYSQRRAIRQVSFQAKTLRSQGRIVLKQCTETLLPLRDEIRQHNALSASISVVLGEVRKKGLRRVLRDTHLPYWQRERPWRIALGSEVLEIMGQARRFEAVQVRFPDDAGATPGAAVEVVDEAAVRDHLEASLPVPDVLRWLHRHYGEYSDAALLRLYNDLVNAGRRRATVLPVAETLVLQTVRVTFHPHGISATGDPDV
jgi:hypothetical protein